MTDGSSLLSAFFLLGMKAQGKWSNRRGENPLDGGAPFYDTYACADGRFIAIDAIEPQFYAELRQRCSIEDPLIDEQHDSARWPLLKLRLADIFRTRTRDEWCAVLEGTDACVAPVLDWDEATLHPHNRSRQTLLDIHGVMQPAPAPRFSRTPADLPQPAQASALEEVLADWGVVSGAAGVVRSK
jgi:alpha-methylacyl-CoA racemase